MVRIDYLVDRLPEDIIKRLFSNIYHIQQNSDRLEHELLTFWDRYFQQINQAQPKENPIAYINLAFLRSAIILDQPAYQVDAYDQNWYLDESLYSLAMTLPSIWQYWQEDMIYLEKHLLHQSLRASVLPHEYLWFKLKYATLYHQVTRELIKPYMAQIPTLESYQALRKSQDLTFYFGEYHDQSTGIFQNPPKEPTVLVDQRLNKARLPH